MRLLHAGAVDPSQDAVFHNLVGPRSAHTNMFWECRGGMLIALSGGCLFPPLQTTAAAGIQHAS